MRIEKIGNYVSEISVRNKKASVTDVFSVTNSQGFIRSTDYFSKEVFSKDITNYKIVSENEFAYNPSRINVGSIDYLQQKSSVIISPLYVVFKCNEKLNEEYLKVFLKSPVGNSKIRMKTKGTVRDNLSFGSLCEIKIPILPIDSQLRIANILSDAETLITQRQESIRLLDEFLKGTFSNLFDNPVKNRNGYKIVRLKELITFLTSGGRGWGEYYSEKGQRFIRSLDVQMNYISNEDPAFVNPPNNQEANRTKVQDFDILLTITGSKIGRVAMVPVNFGTAYVSQHVAIIRTQKINPLYLSYYLSDVNCGQYLIQKCYYGQTKPGLNFKQIENFEIIIPPIELQNQFAQIVERTDGLKAQYQQSLRELEILYGSLSQRAFKGELTLK